MTWTQLWSDPYPYAVVLIVLIIDTGIFTFLSWYFERVLPSQFGLRLPPWFIFTVEYWRGHKYSRAYVDTCVEEGEHVEPVDANYKDKASIKIRDLTKKYSTGKVAVNELTLTMYKDQICCLLGHNGAGK